MIFFTLPIQPPHYNYRANFTTENVCSRWLAAAAHCYDDLNEGVDSQPRKILTNTLRDNTIYKENIEMKKVYKHPNYVYGLLYDDIALVQLGRRISYNFTEVSKQHKWVKIKSILIFRTYQFLASCL